VSSVRLVPVWKAVALPSLPARWQRRRLVLALVLAAAVAMVALFAAGVIPMPGASTPAPDAALAAARAQRPARDAASSC
jgi:hypothetical protein